MPGVVQAEARAPRVNEKWWAVERTRASRREQRDERRRGVTAALLGGMTLLIVAVSGLALWYPTVAERTASVGAQFTVDGLGMRVESFTRLADAMTGTNTAKLPMTGPAMSGMGMGAVGGGVKEGEERVLLTLVVTNDGGKPITFTPERMVLTSNGLPVPLRGQPTSDLSEVAVPSGAAMSGRVQFVIAEGTAPLELRFKGDPTRVVLDASIGSQPQTPRQPAGHGSDHN